MNPFDLFEAMTDLEDVTILEAALPSRTQRVRRRPMLRWLSAACVAAVLLFAIAAVSPAEADDAAMGYTLRLREKYAEYIFWPALGTVPEGVPPYVPTWLPEGYTLWEDFSDEFCQSLCYHTADEESSIWFQCYYTGSVRSATYRFESKPYTRETVPVGSYEADLLLEADGTRGYLIWIDQTAQIHFSISFGNIPLEDVLAVAESVQTQKGE